MHRICVVLNFIAGFCVISAKDAYDLLPISPYIWNEGYGPIWDSESKHLIFVDLFNDTINRYDVDTKRFTMATLPISFPTFLIKLKNERNQYLVSSSRVALVIEWDGIDIEARIIRRAFKLEPEPRFIANGLHGAVASPNNKFFVGGTYRGALCVNTSSLNAGFYSYSKETGVIKFDIPNLMTTGGIAFNADGSKVYFVDVCNNFVWQFDFDLNTGRGSNGVVVFTYKNNYGGPLSCMLGITADTAGYLYVVIFNGGVVLKVNPRTKKVVLVIEIPVKIVCGICWGGENHDILFVTTGKPFFDISKGAVYDFAPSYSPKRSGKIYSVTKLGATGVTAHTLYL